jgi:hypothetical protein
VSAVYSLVTHKTLTLAALVSMAVIVSAVVLRAAAVEPALRGSSLGAFSIIRPGVFRAIGVISFAVSAEQ